MIMAGNSGFSWSKIGRQSTNQQTLVMTEGPTGGRSPLREASHMIRHPSEIDRRLANSLNHLDLSPRSAEILTERTERYRVIVQDEVRRRDGEKGEGVFVIALLDGCSASDMPVGSYTREQVGPDQQVSLAACISLAFEVAWVDYLEQVRSPENAEGAINAAISSGAQGAASSAIGIGTIGTQFIADLNESFLRSRSHRTARAMLSAPPPNMAEWAKMLRLFLREILESDFEIRVAPNGTKAVIFSGKASLRAHLTRARYSGDDMKVLDSIARGAAPSWQGAAADALRGGVNRLFIVIAGVLEIKTWIESEKEDWVDLIVRLGLVIVTTILTAILSVIFAKFILGAVAVGIAMKLMIAGVSIAVGMMVAFVFEVARIRQGLAGLVRFAGRHLIESLTAVWGWVRAAWHTAMSSKAAAQ